MKVAQDLNITKKQVNNIKGMEVVLKVNRGRNRIEVLEGCIESAYPSIFTLKTYGGEVLSFSYSDILSKNILFYKKAVKV